MNPQLCSKAQRTGNDVYIVAAVARSVKAACTAVAAGSLREDKVLVRGFCSMLESTIL